MNIKPLNKRILLEPKAEVEEKNGILLAKSVKEKPIEGTVIHVGPECINVKPGDTILFSKYSGTELNVDDKALLILDEEDVIAIKED